MHFEANYENHITPYHSCGIHISRINALLFLAWILTSIHIISQQLLKYIVCILLCSQKENEFHFQIHYLFLRREERGIFVKERFSHGKIVINVNVGQQALLFFIRRKRTLFIMFVER